MFMNDLCLQNVLLNSFRSFCYYRLQWHGVVFNPDTPEKTDRANPSSLDIRWGGE